jgi:dTDP-4-amino-4,6-dideoxygalactose transaminase
MNGKYYDKNINNPKIKLLYRNKKIESSYWLYSLLVDNKKKFKKYLSKFKIESDEISFRNDRYTVFKKYKNHRSPGLDYFSKHMINIPVGWWVSKKSIKKIVKIVNNY